MTGFEPAAVERHVYRIVERDAIQRKREAGEPWPWTVDPILRELYSINNHREDDRRTRWTTAHWRTPHADDPDLWFAMVVAAFVNLPDTLAEIGYPVPWDPERFLAVMAARPKGRQYGSAYMIHAGPKGVPKPTYQADKVFAPLWYWRDHLRPKVGERLAEYFERLSRCRDMGGFMAAQVIADLKYVEPLKSAADWWDWAASGPGSRRGMYRVLGRPLPKDAQNAPWRAGESDWLSKMHDLGALIAPTLESAGIGRLHAQDLQNCLCEFDKYERARLGEGKSKQRRYRPSHEPLPMVTTAAEPTSLMATAPVIPAAAIGAPTAALPSAAADIAATAGTAEPCRRPENGSTFKITFFDDYAAKTKREAALSLDEVAALVRKTRMPRKDALPWLKFAVFGDAPSNNGSLRHNGNVLEISGIVADYDGEVVPIDDAVARLAAAGIRGLVYATPSHTDAKPRWRVCCPTSRTLPPDEHYRLVSRLNGPLGGILAGESWVLSQSYYYGAVGEGMARAVVVDGTRTIDEADDLDAGAIGKPYGAAHAAGAEPEADIADIRAALELIPNDGRHWESERGADGQVTILGWNTIGMAIWRASGGSPEGLEAFKAFSRKSPKNIDDETEYRWNHLHRSPPSRIGFGTLVYLARQTVPEWLPPSRARPEAPVIQVAGGNRPKAAVAGMKALRDAGTAFYRRDKNIVYIMRIPMKASDGRMILIPGIAPVATLHLAHTLGKAAVWMKFDARRKGGGDWVQVDLPKEIPEAIAALPNEWPFDPITGVISTPTMRPDGTLLTTPGYDPATGFVLFDPPPMPPMPPMPGKEDARQALALLLGLVDEFPFADDASKSVALSLILSLVLRPALAPVVPLHVANAPEGGTGKSYLFDVASVIALGEVCPVIARGITPEETEKRLVGAALEGRPLILIDNCNGELRSEFLCQAAERPLIKPRPLGTSRMPTITERLRVRRQRQQHRDRRGSGAAHPAVLARRQHGKSLSAPLQARSGARRSGRSRALCRRSVDDSESLHRSRYARPAAPIRQFRSVVGQSARSADVARAG
jgi:hypothetical protein